MALTPEEEQRLRDEIRKKLEERERKETQHKIQSEEEKREQLEERLRAKIKEEEEEKFYSEKGYVKYKNRHGEIEWLLPEDAERRKNSRRKHKPTTHHYHKRRALRNTLINTALVVGALLVLAFLYKYNPGKAPKTGSLLVQTDIPGAAVYIDGDRLGYFTPDTIAKLTLGKHFVSVFKEGYAAIPPMAAVQLVKNRLAAVSFELKNSYTMSAIRLKVNVNGCQLYVDGLPFQIGKDNIAKVPYGYHTFMVVKSGYIGNPSYRRLLIEKADTTDVEFELLPDTDIGYLQVSDNLFTGYVYLDRDFSGMQARGDLLPVRSGTYEVRVRKNGFACLPDSQLVNILPGEKRMVVFRLLPQSRNLAMNIRTESPGAAIFVDGEWLPFTTPVDGIDLSPGSHFVNLVRDSLQYAQRDVPMYAGERSNLNFEFKF